MIFAALVRRSPDQRGDSETGMRLRLLFASLLAAGPAFAAETITYTYDAEGRVVKVVRTGTVNNNVVVDYERDKADNRTKVKVTGSPNPPPP